MDETTRPEGSRVALEVERIAELCHEASRRYCELLGDRSQVAWSEAPDWQRESVITGVIAVLRGGPGYHPSESHRSWLATKELEGWRYGEVKDPAARTHPCMRPWGELPAEQRFKDVLFVEVVRAVVGLARVLDCKGSPQVYRYLGRDWGQGPGQAGATYWSEDGKLIGWGDPSVSVEDEQRAYAAHLANRGAPGTPSRPVKCAGCGAGFILSFSGSLRHDGASGTEVRSAEVASCVMCAGGDAPCLRCGGKLRHVSDEAERRHLLLFADEAEADLHDVWRCQDCGQVHRKAFSEGRP